MTAFVDGPVRLSVPATSANVGPGYDSIGMALELRDELTARVTGSGLTISVQGEGRGEVPLDESHLVVRAMRTGFEALGTQPPGLALECRNVIPHGRGLGSSSAAIVAGLSLARELVAGGSLIVDDDALLAIGCDIEGHPDNVAPAMLGGLVVAGREAGSWYAVGAGVDPRVSVVAMIPTAELPTEVARGLIPDVVPHSAAAANAGRAALLIAALAGQPEHLFAGTRDFLHQEYRRAAMPESLELLDALRADGIPAIISGAGPTVLAFCDAPTGASGSAGALMDRCPDGWMSRHLVLSADGVRLGSALVVP